MSHQLIDLIEGLKGEVEHELARMQRDYDDLMNFAMRMSCDKKRLTDQVIRLIERVLELEMTYEQDLAYQRHALRPHKDSHLREISQAICNNRGTRLGVGSSVESGGA